jgi:hypothetical protein
MAASDLATGATLMLAGSGAFSIDNALLRRGPALVPIVMVMVRFNIRRRSTRRIHPTLIRGERPSRTGLNVRPPDYSLMPGIGDRVSPVTSIGRCASASRIVGVGCTLF